MTQTEILKLMKNGKKKTPEEISKKFNLHQSTAYTQMRKMYMRGELEREWERDTGYVYFRKKADMKGGGKK